MTFMDWSNNYVDSVEDKSFFNDYDTINGTYGTDMTKQDPNDHALRVSSNSKEQ